MWRNQLFRIPAHNKAEEMESFLKREPTLHDVRIFRSRDSLIVGTAMARCSRACGIEEAGPCILRSVSTGSNGEVIWSFIGTGPAFRKFMQRLTDKGIMYKTLELEYDESATSEYVRLFEMGAAPLCETSYTCAGNPELKTYEMADIAGFYRAFGLKQAYGNPDDIRAELEFISLLLVKELIAISNSDTESAALCRDARRKFYSEHLSRWVEALASRVGGNTSKPLYIHLTNLLKMVVLNGGLMG